MIIRFFLNVRSLETKEECQDKQTKITVKCYDSSFIIKIASSLFETVKLKSTYKRRIF